MAVRLMLHSSLLQEEKEKRRHKLRKIFDEYATNGSEYLCKDELKSMIEANRCPRFAKKLVKHMIDASDNNKDGCLDFEEFCTLCKDDLIVSFLKKYCRVVMSSHVKTPTAIDEADELDGEYEENMSLWPPPLVGIAFTIIQTAIFIVDHVATEQNHNSKATGPMATLFIYNPKLRHEVWRFVTYMFIHIDYTHLVSNILIQILLSIVLEIVHRWWRVALVYLAGVLAGSMGSSIFNPRFFLAGASGGGYALITAQLAAIIMNWREMQLAVVQLFVIVVFIFLENYISGMDQISSVAHACGALGGLLSGIGVLWNLREVPWERKLKWLAITVYIMLMGAGIMYHFLNPAHFY